MAVRPFLYLGTVSPAQVGGGTRDVSAVVLPLVRHGLGTGKFRDERGVGAAEEGPVEGLDRHSRRARAEQGEIVVAASRNLSNV